MKLLIALTVLLVAANVVNAIELTEKVDLKEVESLMADIAKEANVEAEEEILGSGTWVSIGRAREIQALRSSGYGSSVRYYKYGFHQASQAVATGKYIVMRYRTMGCSAAWTSRRGWQTWCMYTRSFGQRVRMAYYSRGAFMLGGWYLGR